MDAGGRLPPASKFNVLFAGTEGKPPLRGNLQMSLEEGLLRDLAMRACSGPCGKGIFDATCSPAAGAGRLFGHLARRMSFAVLRGTADVILDSICHLGRRPLGPVGVE